MLYVISLYIFQAFLNRVRSFDFVNWDMEQIVKINAPLAIHLAYDWLNRNKIEKLNGISSYVHNDHLHELLPTFQKILKSFQFPGRFQYIKIRNLK